MPQKPSVGRVVHYVLKNKEVRPAMIVKVNDEEATVNLQVFTDGRNDLEGTGEVANVVHKTDVSVSDDPQPEMWMWPPYVASGDDDEDEEGEDGEESDEEETDEEDGDGEDKEESESDEDEAPAK